WPATQASRMATAPRRTSVARYGANWTDSESWPKGSPWLRSDGGNGSPG
ncbi:MAG: hypothetical protein AVDCRST_MAG75-2717, partial [uncultured Propionibacteriaceae bacterium]